jgi:hypothetical protein
MILNRYAILESIRESILDEYIDNSKKKGGGEYEQGK